MVALNEERDVPFEKGEDFAIRRAVAGSEIHRGAYLGWSGATEFVRPFVDGDVSAGVARESLDSRTIQAGDEQPLEVQVSGRISVPVTGVVSDLDHGKAVFITDDQTANLSDTGSDTQFGNVKTVTAAGRAIVAFDAT